MNRRPLIDRLDAAVRERMLNGPASPIIVPARLGTLAGRLGAALAADGADNA